MTTTLRIGCLAALLAASAVLPAPVRAGETYHTCRGFIDSVPATLATQGVWCLRQDLSTAINSGNAITIAANNVTIDCNGFKLGGLAAGASTNTRGIRALQRQNITVRNCNIRGFARGIDLAIDGGDLGTSAGHVVRGNRLDNNTVYGISAVGENILVADNLVYDTGGRPNTAASFGIAAYGHVIGNTVSGVYATATNAYSYGISTYGTGSQEIRGNRVRGLASSGLGVASAIYTEADSVRIIDNHVAALALTGGYGLRSLGADTSCSGNHVVLLITPYSGCAASLGNSAL